MDDKEYQQGLATFLSAKLDLSESDVDQAIRAYNKELRKLHKEIYICHPSNGNSCKLGHGLDAATFKVKKNRWKEICEFVEKNRNNPEMFNLECDFTEGGHGCVIDIDLLEIYDECYQVLSAKSTNLNDTFLVMIEDLIEENEN